MTLFPYTTLFRSYSSYSISSNSFLSLVGFEEFLVVDRWIDLGFALVSLVQILQAWSIPSRWVIVLLALSSPFFPLLFHGALFLFLWILFSLSSSSTQVFLFFCGRTMLILSGPLILPRDRIEASLHDLFHFGILYLFFLFFIINSLYSTIP